MTIKPFKAYIAMILFLGITTQTINTGITPMPRYLQCLQRPQGKNYAFNCQLIDMTRVIRGLSLLMYYRITHKKKNLDSAITLIKNQLREFETWLLHEEQNILTTIKNKYAMSDEVWLACTTDMHTLKSIYKNAIKQPWPHTYHEENIPTDLLTSLKTILIKNSINPASVTIKMATETNNAVQMRVKSATQNYKDHSNNNLVIAPKYIPITIEIFPNLLNSSNSLQKTLALCAHETQHIVQQHGLTDSIMRSYLEHYCSVNAETLQTCPEYHKLIQIHEAQAELLSAINDSDIADCLKGYRSSTYYPKYLYEEHYYNLSNIAMLWKLDSWLSFIHHNGFKNKAHDLLAKMHSLADSFKEFLA